MIKLVEKSEGISFTSVWDAIEDTPAEAQNMKVRSDLMIEIREFIKRHNLTQAQAAKYCHITQPRMSDLMHGKIDKFSVDALINIAASANLKISILVEEDAFA
jgi:predicted XRE-type DNA-binding protein